MTTTIIDALKTYLKTYTGWTTGAPFYVDFLGKKPDQYALVPQPGDPVMEWNIDYGSEREYSFAVQSMFSTADDAERLANSGFYEALGDWFDSQTQSGNMPTMASNQHPVAIQTTSRAFIYEEGESTNGVYQILCKLLFDQDKPS